MDWIEWMMMMLARRLTQFARSLGAVRIGQSGGLIIKTTQLQQAQVVYFSLWLLMRLIWIKSGREWLQKVLLPCFFISSKWLLLHLFVNFPIIRSNLPIINVLSQLFCVLLLQKKVEFVFSNKKKANIVVMFDTGLFIVVLIDNW